MDILSHQHIFKESSGQDHIILLFDKLFLRMNDWMQNYGKQKQYYKIIFLLIQDNTNLEAFKMKIYS
ncbi:hypothetical protein pb186bvf_003282 [Paramecium bursaria]